jgi:hypothetical protein
LYFLSELHLPVFNTAQKRFHVTLCLPAHLVDLRLENGRDKVSSPEHTASEHRPINIAICEASPVHPLFTDFPDLLGSKCVAENFANRLDCVEHKSAEVCQEQSFLQTVVVAHSHFDLLLLVHLDQDVSQ